jgi:beta-glucosidase
MKRHELIMGILTSAAVLSGCNGGQSSLPQLGKNSVDEVVAAMTDEEKILLLLGCGQRDVNEPIAVVGATDDIIPGAAGTTHGVQRLGVPQIVLADGPAGLRIKPVREGSDKTYYCTAFPIASALSSTWNKELVNAVGRAMGQEVKEYGVDVILGPGVNIHRNPLCGRNYEYYSEDPVLAGKTAAAIINGIQENGVGTSIKHFAANNQETFRTSTDSRVTQRALREIYLKPFEIALKESSPWTVMSSYNYINGVYTSESRELCHDILKTDFGFKGLVMTDWFAGMDAVAQVSSENDLLMPGTDRQYNQIKEGLKNGTLTMKQVDENVKRLLELVLKTPRFNGYRFSDAPDLKAHAEITRQSAAEGMVLLTNRKNALPLSGVKKVAVFGATSYEFVSGGTGSGDVNEEYTVSLMDGLKNSGFEPDMKLAEIYKTEIAAQKKVRDADPSRNNDFVYRFMPENFSISEKDMNDYAKNNDFAVLTIGRCSGEFRDRRIADFYLSDKEKELLGAVKKAFSKLNKKVIVILNAGGVIETKSWIDTPDAVLLAWMGGQEGGNAVADILTGKVNPSGKLPVTFAEDYFDYPSAKNFPYDYQENNKSMYGRGAERGNDENLDYTNYIEDIFVGYRYFSTFGKKVSFPFGFGLSYTQFAFSDFTAALDKDVVKLSLKVKNTGKTAGKEVAQIYVSAPQTGQKKPLKELKDYAKTPLLQPGEEKLLTFEIPVSDLASFETEKSSWVLEKGVYKFSAGNSSENILQTQDVDIQADFTKKCSDVLKVRKPFEVLGK